MIMFNIIFLHRRVVFSCIEVSDLNVINQLCGDFVVLCTGCK